MCAYSRKESPIFLKARDFNAWLFQHTAKFPRQYRHTLTERIECSALDILDALGAALVLKDAGALQRADYSVWRTRQLLRMAHDLGLFAARLLEYAFAALEEIGRLLGAWIKKGEEV